MRVLSLFDGISCGRIALERAEIPVTEYYASEIDEYAIKISRKNYPDIIQLGDVQTMDIPQDIDLMIGGSPCQGFSFAGRRLNFADPRSRLFFNFVETMQKVKPKYFLLENTPMSLESRNIITSYMGVEPIEINSNLVSAQNRKRYYWTNIPIANQLEDKGIMLQDIMNGTGHEEYSFEKYNPIETKNYIQFDVSGKGHKSQQDRVYKLTGKFGCLPNARAVTKIKVLSGQNTYRNLTLNEVEDLQTVPHNYTLLDEKYSFGRSLSALGNGWTVDVIAHILRGINQ